MRGPKRTVAIAGSLFVLLALYGTARAHGSGPSAWDAIVTKILAPSCFSGCHGSSGNGGMPVGANNEDYWYPALVNAVPANGAAAAFGKLRVDPLRPWNSYLVDKLTGDLKWGEANPMPNLQTPYVFDCPGGVDRIVKWILAGAPQAGNVNGISLPFPSNYCDLPQPEIGTLAPPDPSEGVQLDLAAHTFSVSRPAREGAKTTDDATLGASDACDNTVDTCYITGVEILASHGTVDVALSRAGDAAPIAVARGPELSLELPPGVGVAVAPNQPLQIDQRIRNDYWVGPKPYTNVTEGKVIVNVRLASSVDSVAEPFIDETGSQVLLVPPNAAGATGGVAMPASGASGAVVGVWSDQRALAVEIVDVPNGAAVSGDVASSGYSEMGGGPFSYACAYTNGWVPNNVGRLGANGILNAVTGPIDVGSPLKWGCEETANVPPGLPAALGTAPIQTCAVSSESVYSPSNVCTSGTQRCKPANLVAGAGADDGRCSLLGLQW